MTIARSLVTFVSWIDARSPRRSHHSPSQIMYALSLRRAPLVLARWGTLTARSGLRSSPGHLAPPSLSSLPRSLPQATLSRLRSIHCYTFAWKNVSAEKEPPQPQPPSNGDNGDGGRAKLKPVEGQEITTFYCISLKKPMMVQTTENPHIYLLSRPKELQRSEAGEYVRVRKFPKVFFYLFDKSEITTASSLKSQSKVKKVFDFDTIPTIPLNKIMPEIPQVDLNLSLKLSLIDTKIIHSIITSFPHGNIAEYEKLLYQVKDAALRATPEELDELIINRSLVEQLAVSRLAKISGLEIDYQGSRIDSRLRVTNISARPDIVLFKWVDPREKMLTAAVAKVSTPHSESDEEGEKDEEDEEDDYNSLYGGVGELKKNTKPWDKFQLLADMVKVCGDLAVSSVLRYGKLFHFIKVYGLLIDCHTEKADLVQVKMDFIKNESTVLQVDTPIYYSEGFNIIGSKVGRASNY